ncbi:type II toxin-antitoxin system VapC family toxin [Pseudolysinimonas sp.]|uniref:type II toxin-antitoxin system VapC family toxin n=1 Tax=Pseudolysinimonas sp. TaxID=2680009 RepID=UPI00286CD55F|nr:type II toxin-antitoxin system VapC family toxin [Pseudolysinimonas sp.]
MGGLTGLVADASAVVEALSGASASGDRARELLLQPVSAPHLLDLEVASALRRATRRGELTAEEARAAVLGLASLPGLRRYGHLRLLPRIWELRDNISTYDASYVALAEALGIPLITADRRLARAAESYCAVVLVD